MGFLKSITILILTTTLVACGGGKSSGGGASLEITTPTDNTLSANSQSLVTVSGKAAPNSTIVVTFPDGSQQQTTADRNGNYSLVSNAPQTVVCLALAVKTTMAILQLLLQLLLKQI